LPEASARRSSLGKGREQRKRYHRQWLKLLITLREEAEAVVFRLVSVVSTLRDDSLVQKPPSRQKSSQQNKKRSHRRLHSIVAQDGRVLR
jgi:hypothetical protein